MKLTRILSASGATLLTTAFLLALAPSVRATPVPDVVYNVTLDLSALTAADSDAPYSLDFQLITGSGNVTNNVTLSNFSFVGGTPSGTPNFTNGAVSGSLATSLVLTNSSAIDNEFSEALSAGVTSISFKVDQTPNSEVVGTGTAIPDQFNVAIQDNDINNVPTTDPSGANILVESDLGPGATVKQFTIQAVPEPASTALSLVAAAGMLGLVLLRRRRAA